MHQPPPYGALELETVKITIDASVNLLARQLPNLFSLPQISATDYIEVERTMFDKGYYNTRINNTPYLALSPAVELFLKKRRGLISAEETEAGINALKAQDSRKSYLDEFYTNATTKQYYLGLKGGSDKHSYLLSGNLEDVLSESYAKVRKLNFSLANQFRLTSKLTLSTQIYYTNSIQKSGRPAYNSLLVGGRSLPYLSFRNADGSASSLASAYRGAFTDTLANSRLLDWKYYPAEEYMHNTTKIKTSEIYANAGLSYKILNGLNGNASYQYQKQDFNSNGYADEFSYNARSAVNSLSQYNRSTKVLTYVVPRGGINRVSNTQVESYTIRGQLNLDRTFGSHHINAIAGAEIREAKSSGNGYTRYGYNEDPLLYVDVDPINTYRNIITGGAERIGSGVQETSNLNRFVSNYANAAYTYLNKYTLSGSLRADGSNIFGASTNDRWKPLWSAGLGWNVASEKFYKLSWLPRLKLKTTFGYSGNVDLSKTALSVGFLGTQGLTSLPYTRITTINNPGLRWEQLSQLGLAVEFGLRENRLSGTLSAFHKRGVDLYGSALYDYTTWGGSSSITKNVAEMSGRGIELDLHSINLKGSAVRWNTDLYFNFNDSKTLKYYNRSGQRLSALLGASNSISPIEGKPLYAMVAYRWAGLDDKGNPRGYLNGVPSTDYAAITAEAFAGGDNISYIGTASPLFYGAVINTFYWKRFSVSFNVSYKLGYYARIPSFSSSAIITNGAGHSDFANRWQKAGDELNTNVPAFQYPANSARDGFYESSEVNVIKADHIRLDYLNLNYRFDLNREGAGFKSLEIFSGMQNLGIIWKANKRHIDPDNINNVSPSKALTFGVRASF